MPERFPDTIVDQAWNNAHSKCQRCKKPLNKGSRGKESPMGWEAHHKNSNGPATASNCEILCQDCHKGTRNYGRS